MPAALDPTYPLHPIGCLLAALMLLCVMLTSFIRQKWNRGVAFLCFWLFFENLTLGIDGIIWADNADVKLYVYCDIVSHVQLIAYVVKPMAILIITRRLYLMTRLQPVRLPGSSAERWDLLFEWLLGVVIPIVVAGPLYYIVQALRFKITGGYGCQDVVDISVLGILLVHSWALTPSLISICFYYPRAVLALYRHGRDRNRFLQNSDSTSRINYIRILILASLDILLTFPIGITTIVFTIGNYLSLGPLPFYSGWTYVHMEWEPEGNILPPTATGPFGVLDAVPYYFNQWTSPVLAYVIFALFGVTSEARASYWQLVDVVGGRLGLSASLFGKMGDRAEDMSFHAKTGELPSFVDADIHLAEQGVQRESESAQDRLEDGRESSTVPE
ncbi:unnamed protein product [Peniophora sp. CBMAI 1063]|nr:unnamed protein product [Peniophora sp. CBMAI 1063]